MGAPTPAQISGHRCRYCSLVQCPLPLHPSPPHPPTTTFRLRTRTSSPFWAPWNKIGRSCCFLSFAGNPKRRTVLLLLSLPSSLRTNYPPPVIPSPPPPLLNSSRLSFLLPPTLHWCTVHLSHCIIPPSHPKRGETQRPLLSDPQVARNTILPAVPPRNSSASMTQI